MKHSSLLKILVIFLITACGQEERIFKNLHPKDSGITFKNELEESDDFNILDYLYFYNGGGTAVGDINNDGLVDIFFSGNQVDNKLYLNKGNLQFEDITESAGINKNSDWNTGAIMGDVNQDGLLDIYVCAVVGIKGLTGFNELYINNGDNTFTESASSFGLDFDSYSSSAAFLDYDQDGDLDIYLLNHAIHTPESFGKADLRYKRSYETGDKLLRNDGNSFTDVSEDAGIYGGVNGYGLGLAVSDFNNDGFPDIFVGNDFHEDDYFYLNNGDGTFSESLREYFGYSSRFSMGNDVADINNDGFQDIISLDMLPEDEKVLKTSEGDENYNIMRLRNDEYGYYYQFSRNMLFLGQSNGKFLESANLSGVESTDWSWSALFADFDLDGFQDLFISNGIPRRPNDLDYIKFVSGDQIKNTINQTKIVDQEALELMPDGAVNNYLFKGNGLAFKNYTKNWMHAQPSYSTSSALADLDNDGDLDIITNNVNGSASILINEITGNYLSIGLRYTDQNKFGIGAKVYAFTKGEMQYKELYTARGFQASSEPRIHFGLGEFDNVDSLKIIWPNGSQHILFDVPSKQTIEILYSASTGKKVQQSTKDKMFTKVDILQIKHEEDRYLHFDRQKLIPFQASDRGPAIAVGDLNGDNLDDVFIGGSKFKGSKIVLQTTNGFKESTINLNQLLKNEAIDAVIADFNGDGLNDIVVANGGSDFFGKADPLKNSYLIQSSKGFKEVEFPVSHENTSVIKPFDWDGDGDLDLFIGSHSITGDYGKIPASYFLENNKGKFIVVETEMSMNLGMINDATWTDFDSDGKTDLIAVGEWMVPVFLRNIGNSFEIWDANVTASGIWFSIHPHDIDKDGDVDYMLGNWGLNSLFEASESEPLKMFYADFDENGSTETIVAINKNGKYYPIESFDELAGQIVSLKKKYTSYQSFAGQSVQQVFSESIEGSVVYNVNQLSSGYLRNDNGNFVFVPFDKIFQLAPITSFLSIDLDADGSNELITVGNYFGVKPFMGRLGSFPGGIVWDEVTYELSSNLGLDMINKSVRRLKLINFNGEEYLLVAINNQPFELYQIEN